MRVWAVEGSNGAGRPLAQRLLEAGEHVVDVPAKLAARVRLFDTGHNRKTDALDAHSIAIVAVRTNRSAGPCRRTVSSRRCGCSPTGATSSSVLRVQTVNRLQRLLAELIPGQRKKDITALQAKAMLATVRPRDVAGKTRRRIAAEELADLIAVEAKIKKITAELKTMVTARGSTPDGHPRRRASRGRPDPGRRRRRRTVRRPEPVRVLDRHRTTGRLLR
ncbi:MAG: hypothetical protein WKF73_10400 [Nocardioidaceae bacterium]